MKNSRYFEINSLTKYMSKRYHTRINDIRDKYRFIQNQGPIIGNSEDEMIS